MMIKFGYCKHFKKLKNKKITKTENKILIEIKCKNLINENFIKVDTKKILLKLSWNLMDNYNLKFCFYFNENRKNKMSTKKLTESDKIKD